MSAKKQTFEQEIARLEEIVAALEKGDAPFSRVSKHLSRADVRYFVISFFRINQAWSAK